MKNFRDVYKFPLRKDDCTSWVYDAKNQFVFQFEFTNAILEHNIVEVLNGNEEPTIPHNFIHECGVISENGNKYILIRGWGNLTGIGAHNLPHEEARNIQDTFADFIVERLNSFVPEKFEEPNKR